MTLSPHFSERRRRALSWLAVAIALMILLAVGWAVQSGHPTTRPRVARFARPFAASFGAKRPDYLPGKLRPVSRRERRWRWCNGLSTSQRRHRAGRPHACPQGNTGRLVRRGQERPHGSLHATVEEPVVGRADLGCGGLCLGLEHVRGRDCPRSGDLGRELCGVSRRQRGRRWTGSDC